MSLPSDSIAVIGMTGRFPGARNLAEYWRNLCDGVESISFFTEEEMSASGIDRRTFGRPGYVNAGAVLEDADMFDAAFFEFSPREAEAMDPQHRLFLEGSWQAMEEAGYDPARYDHPVGVFAGLGLNTYLLFNLISDPGRLGTGGSFQEMIANDKDFLPTRVSYRMNLKGPSVNVQSACSTSLVAIHLACQSILNGECSMALAGGVAVNVPLRGGYLYQEGHILSPDGHCRPFDAGAAGTVNGSGMGVVVLKMLDEALEAGDRIHAVIRGSAVNNDGSLRVGYAAPGVQGQSAVITEALGIADVDPQEIGYVEAHGTGTHMGDPIEIAALAQAFRAGGAEGTGQCPIGSVKSNVGHLGAAAGVAGFAKAVMALEHEAIPPSLHFERPNPNLNLEATPFYVNNRLQEWPRGATPRRAGVSSFGLGGTNAHVVLEEAPQREPGDNPRRPYFLLPISAATPAALEQAAANLRDHLEAHPEQSLADTAYTLQVGRAEFAHRMTVVCRNRAEAVAALGEPDPDRVAVGAHAVDNRSVVFMFPGGGAQYVGMGEELYRTEPVFREWLDRCAELLADETGLDVREWIYPSEEHREQAEQRLRSTGTALPALFSVEYALARLWMSWGIEPEAMIGHSLGEYVAAAISGVLSLEDALALVSLRGRLFERLPSGGMLSIPASEETIRPMLDDGPAIAAVNGRENCVVSGAMEAIDRLEERLRGEGVEPRKVQIDVAAHSPMVEPILEEFRSRVEQLRLNPPGIPYISNVTGTWMTPADACDPGYWVRHIRRTVRFADGIAELTAEPGRLLLEVGPGRTLGTLARGAVAQGSEPVIVTSMRHPQEHLPDEEYLLKTLGRLWIAGVPVNWSGFYNGERRLRVGLPTYPFERRRYWIEPGRGGAATVERGGGREDDPTRWLYARSWNRSLGPVATVPEQTVQGLVLLVADEEGGEALALHLRKKGVRAITILPGDSFEQRNNDSYIVNQGASDDYLSLLNRIEVSEGTPLSILHLGSLSPKVAEDRENEFRRVRRDGFESLLNLVRALGEWKEGQKDLERIDLLVATNGVQEVTGSEMLHPVGGMMTAACRVIEQEFPFIHCRTVDLDQEGKLNERTLRMLADELLQPTAESVLAFRGGHRWVERFERLEPAEAAEDSKGVLKEKGVYLITGGLGGVGSALAGMLARRCAAQLVLVGRTPMPPREEWDRVLSDGNADESLVRRIERVRHIESRGGEVLTVTADVADREQMERAVAEAERRFGRIDGVIHAAGAIGRETFRTIREITPEDFEAQFRPKVDALFILDDLFRERPVDFVLLISSLASVLGGLGYAAYAAANRCMDAVALERRTAGLPWTSVAMESWRLDAPEPTAEATAPSHLPEGVIAEMLEHVMTRVEGERAYASVLNLAGRIPDVAISTAELNRRIADARRTTASGIGDESTGAGDGTLHPRPQLATPYVAPRNEDEETVAAIWRDLLGLEQVGVHDNFFELGGQSLIATQLLTRLRESMRADITFHDLFETNTPARLAALIAERREQEEAGKKAALLAMLEEMSDEEVEAAMSGGGDQGTDRNDME